MVNDEAHLILRLGQVGAKGNIALHTNKVFTLALALHAQAAVPAALDRIGDKRECRRQMSLDLIIKYCTNAQADGDTRAMILVDFDEVQY